MVDTWIDTKIMYEPGGDLALAYNRAMQTSASEWVLLLDHDVYLLNPHWYTMCLEVVNRLKKSNVGWISAVTNRIGCGAQKVKVDNNDDDIQQHTNTSSKLYNIHGTTTVETASLLSGFFILTNKTAWRYVGGFHNIGDNLLGIDNDYSRQLKKSGFRQYIMKGLYVYHYHSGRKKELYRRFK